MQPNNNSSTIQKTLSKASQISKECITKQITNGAGIPLWFELWVNGCSLVNKLGWNAVVLMGGPRVSDLLSQREWIMDFSCLPSIICSEIHQLSIDKAANRYYLKWVPDTTGKFTLKFVRNKVKAKFGELDWSKIMQNKCCAIKMSISALLAKLNKLNTKDRLARWNDEIAQMFVLFEQHVQSTYHYFLLCVFNMSVGAVQQ